MAKQTGFAVLGLTGIAQHTVLSAFTRAADHCRLAAIVSGDRQHAQTLAQQYRAAPYHFDELRQCLSRDDVNAVFIAAPNAMRCDYAVEAARAGVHVLAEYPMSVTADECRRVLRTCQTNRVKLMISYPHHFQPGPVKAVDIVRAGHIGMPKTFSADITTRLDNADDVRLQRRLGGGTVYATGVLAVNASRTLLGAEPAQVMAMTSRANRRYGGDVDEGAVALIRFPDERLVHFHTSFGEEPLSTFTLFGEDGYIRLTNAFSLAPMTMQVVRTGRVEELTFDAGDPYSAEFTYFAECIQKDRPPEPSGIDGLQDVRIVEAIYRSARDGRPVTLPRLARIDAPAAEPDVRKAAERQQAS
jgi:glucose-fructose oxidoreductase